MAHVPLHESQKASSPGRPSVHPTPFRSDGRAHGGGLAPLRRPRRDGQPRDGGADGLEEARSDAALARHSGRLEPDRLFVVRRLRLLRGHARRHRPAKVRAVGDWRTSDLFDERERAVLEYAEAATGCPAEVSDELAARVRAHLGDAEFVELAAWVALENFRSRFNAGPGAAEPRFLRPLRGSRSGTSD